MGIKLEFILFLAICIITIGTVMLKLDDTITVKNKAKKELEFKKTTFIEVDQKKQQSHAFVEKGMRKQGVLYLDHLRYSTKNISSLVSDNATYVDNIVILDGHIRFEENRKNIYHAKHATYNQNTEILTIPSSFTARNDKNTIQGTFLVYHAIDKELHAKGINAIIYTAKK